MITEDTNDQLNYLFIKCNDLEKRLEALESPKKETDEEAWLKWLVANERELQKGRIPYRDIWLAGRASK